MKKNILIFLLLLTSFSVSSEESKLVNEYIIKVPEGMDIFAVEDGDIISYGYNLDDGMFIIVDYPSLSMSIKYRHLKKFMYFNENKVFRGDKIGVSGFSGNISEPEISIVITLKDSFIFSGK